MGTNQRQNIQEGEKMKAQDYLKKAHRLYELIESLKDELAELRVLADAIAAPVLSDLPKAPSRSTDPPYVRYVMKIVELESKIEEEIENYLTIKDEIRNVINEVLDNEERLLLRYRYINFLEWDDIAEKMHVTTRTAHRIHGAALLRVKIPE